MSRLSRCSTASKRPTTMDRRTKPRWRHAAAGLLALFVANCATPLRTATSVPARAEPAAAWRQMVFGLCEDYPEETRSLEKARADLASARATGVQVLRIAFGWDAMEPEHGRYDWSFWDEFVRMAVDEY